MENNELIKCAKCKSTQITANKSGFSGAKAVGGAILTGGIGILAGTIGSNNVKLTCMACGHTFKPGYDAENLQATKDKEQEEVNKTMKSPLFWILYVVLIIIFIKACA